MKKYFFTLPFFIQYLLKKRMSQKDNLLKLLYKNIDDSEAYNGGTDDLDLYGILDEEDVVGEEIEQNLYPSLFRKFQKDIVDKMSDSEIDFYLNLFDKTVIVKPKNENTSYGRYGKGFHFTRDGKIVFTELD